MSDFVALDDSVRFTCSQARRAKFGDTVREVIRQTQEAEEGTWVYRFCETPDAMAVNHVYRDARAFLEHLENVSAALAEATKAGDGGLLFEVGQKYMSGPAGELDKIRPHFQATYFETLEGGVSRFELKNDDDQGAGGRSGITSDKGDSASPQSSSFTILPVFKVHDWSRVRAELVDPCIKVASKEEGCLYYSFAKSEETSQLACRDRYASAEDAVKHLDKVGPIIAACVEAGVVTLDYSCAYAATKEALEMARPALEPLGTELRVITSGFERIALAPSPSEPP
jgi:quinol monooxygenase YgiN